MAGIFHRTNIDTVYVKVRKYLGVIFNCLFWLFITLPMGIIYVIATLVLFPLIILFVISDAKSWESFKYKLNEIYVEIPKNWITEFP